MYNISWNICNIFDNHSITYYIHENLIFLVNMPIVNINRSYFIVDRYFLVSNHIYLYLHIYRREKCIIFHGI